MRPTGNYGPGVPKDSANQGVAPADQTLRCDHICLKDDGHVCRGEPHYYGYEIPSPRMGMAPVTRTLLTDLRAWLRDQYGASDFVHRIDALLKR